MGMSPHAHLHRPKHPLESSRAAEFRRRLELEDLTELVPRHPTRESVEEELVERMALCGAITPVHTKANPRWDATEMPSEQGDRSGQPPDGHPEGRLERPSRAEIGCPRSISEANRAVRCHPRSAQRGDRPSGQCEGHLIRGPPAICTCTARTPRRYEGTRSGDVHARKRRK